MLVVVVVVRPWFPLVSPKSLLVREGTDREGAERRSQRRLSCMFVVHYHFGWDRREGDGRDSSSPGIVGQERAGSCVAASIVVAHGSCVHEQPSSSFECLVALRDGGGWK